MILAVREAAGMISLHVAAWEIHHFRRARRYRQEYPDAQARGDAAGDGTQGRRDARAWRDNDRRADSKGAAAFRDNRTIPTGRNGIDVRIARATHRRGDRTGAGGGKHRVVRPVHRLDRGLSGTWTA